MVPLDQNPQVLPLRDVASLINSGGDLETVLHHLVLAACRHADWTMGSIMSIDEPHGRAYVLTRHDPALIKKSLPESWELATSPSIVALRRNEPVHIRDARLSTEFPGYQREAFERDYRTVLVIPMKCVDRHGRPMVLTVVSRNIVDVAEEQLAFLGLIVHLGEIAVEKQHRLEAEQLAGEKLQKALQAQTSLLNQALAEPSVSALAARVGVILPNPTLVVDFAANLVVAHRSPDPSVFSDVDWEQSADTVMHQQILKAARTAAEHAETSERTLVFDNGRVRLTVNALVEALRIDGEVVGALLLFPVGEEFGRLDRMLLESAKFALSVVMMRSFVRFRFETRSLEEIFNDLVDRGASRDRGDVQARARHLGLDLGSPHQMIIVDLHQGHRSEIVDLRHVVARAASRKRISATVVALKNLLVCIVPAAMGKAETAPNFAPSILDEVRRYSGQDPTIICSMPCHQIADYATEWGRCERMLRIGRAFARTGILNNENFGPLPMLLAAANVPDTRHFVEESIGPLARYDGEHGTPYLETLSSYLNVGCRSQACADAMGLHVTTLRYRLARLKELFDVDVDSPDKRFRLELAIQLHRIIHDNPAPATLQNVP